MSNLATICRTAKECDMAVQSLHAKFEGSAAMWSGEKTAYEPALKELLASLEGCVKHNIPIMVVHPWIGFDNVSEPTNAGLENYAKLVSEAEKHNIKIAIENTEGDEYLFALLEHFKNSPRVGFCWDSGHEMCYNHSIDLLQKYGDRLIMTHLNDNLGIKNFKGKVFWTDDLHLLPYDGVADWDYNVERLKKSTMPEYLNFELNINSKLNRHENDVYGAMTHEQYFTEAYKRACKIAYKLHR